MLPIMTDSQSVQRGENLTTFVRRNNLYLSRKGTLLITGPSGSASDSIINVFKNDDIGSGGDVVGDEAAEKSRIRKAEKRVRVFPPILSSLNRNGRPKFSLKTVRKDGRLQISIVPNHFSEVIRTPQDGGRVSMELLQTGGH